MTGPRILLFLIIILSPFQSLYAGNTKEYYNKISYYSRTNKPGKVIYHAKKFLKRYPRSTYVPYVRLMRAENESDPEDALTGYNIVIKKYRYFPKRDYARYKRCEILDLLSRWKELKAEADRGIKKFPRSPYIDEFRLFRVHACVMLGLFEAAEKECLLISKSNHSYDILARTMLYQAHINRKITGYSRTYIYSLRELALGFKNSDSSPAALYLMGTFYRRGREYNKSWSAFSDIITKYPRSPEAIMARKHLAALKKYSPTKEEYIPGKKAINKAQSIDLRPEIDLESRERSQKKSFFSIHIGPFRSLKRVNSIKKMTREFGLSWTLKLRTGFIIYIGKFNTVDDAMNARIRLAEEFGINGRIVRISGNTRKKYIYEE
ncbi:MAG: hypothetical protein GY754_46880 [bacterium]|nr:hypothetical protein [bacterium]